MPFLQNAWYMICWSDELAGDGAFFTRTILNRPILLYREEDGTVRALHDQCPHRFAPLSKGKLVDGQVRCGYHGLAFDAAGRCVHSPFSKATPAAAKVQPFPVEERHGTIWIWPGDAQAANPALIPNIPHHHDPEMRYVSGLTTAKADYRLLSDNLMDLSHTTFLHPAFGGLDYMPKFRSWEGPDGAIYSDYVIEDMPNFIGEEVIPAARLRHNDCIRWIAPGTHILDSRTAPCDDPDAIMYVPSAHILTPETEKTTHYFWSSALPKDSPMSDEDMLAVLRFAFDEEDKPMVEAVQQRMGDADLWDLNPVLLPFDAGSVRMRRKLQALIENEQAGHGAATSTETIVAA